MENRELKPNQEIIKKGLEEVIRIVAGHRDPTEKIGKLVIEFINLATDPSRRGVHMDVQIYPAEMVDQIGSGKVEGTRVRETYFLNYDPVHQHYVCQRA